jgi:hypothetical protein
MKEKGIDYLLDLLAEVIEGSGRSDRDLERALKVGHGWLRLLLKGRIDLKVRHLEEIGAELGFSLEDFFLRAYGKEGSLEKGRLKIAPSVKSVRGKKGEKPRTQSHLSAAARLEVRELIHEELAKLQEESPEGEEAGEDEES